jgi:16S rRNA processing protein RimM
LSKTPLPLAGGAGGEPVSSRHSPSPNPPRKREGDLREDTVTLAAVSGAHGVTGEVRLKLFAENLDSLKRHKSFNDGALTVKSLRATKDGAIARFAEINDRNAAEKLRSTVLTVPREALPELGEGEYYYSDLLGLPCVSTDGTDLGKCVAVENFGASDVLEIEMPAQDGKLGKKFMVPMTADAVPEWGARADGRIVVDAAFVI